MLSGSIWRRRQRRPPSSVDIGREDKGEAGSCLGQDLGFVEVVQAQAILPHDLALGVQTHAGEFQELLDAVGERAVGVRVIDRHDDVVVADLVDGHGQQLFVDVGADEALP